VTDPRIMKPLTETETGGDSQGQKPDEPPDPKPDRDVEPPNPDQLLARKSPWT